MLKRIIIFVLMASVLYFALLFAKSPQSHTLGTGSVPEASGIARSLLNKELIFCHNDSGGKASVFALDTRGRLRAELRLEGAHNRDWEEIATAIDPISKKAYIYVGEIGDNNARYKHLSFYRFPEPEIQDSLILIDDYEQIDFQYEDGPRDAEAFFVDPKSGDIYIISKREEQVGIYHLPYPQNSGSILMAKKLGQMQMNWVTAADISPNGKYILVKNYGSIRRFRRGNNLVKALGKRGKDMPYQLEAQGEAICFDARGKGYYTLSEALEDKPQLLYYYK
ncbi:MAG: hypothetical protein PHO85_06195 [Candidatus Cloacimonetes bacterium]|nr:hypothetical protein [Candidatus Cloacimonadota bacterium]MDD2506254.1 hypothetical protein [Candidatus Cloacimonadota bacterium]MDD4148090.1 hypothetical protein [Candidatus Cloacimonadota bacterium]MDD4559307.1 hypothetical protein [Candidatus Cloacimonadota bacterium]